MITTRRKVRNHNKQFTIKHNPFKSKQYKEHLNEHIPINKTLDTALCRIREELINECSYKQNKHDNLTRKERKALNELIHNPHLVINKADKGNTVVVKNRQDYIKNAKTHLNNPQVYNKLQQDPTHTLKEKIIQKLDKLKHQGFLQNQWYEFCYPPETHRTSTLYFLKKIHKNPPGIRPIVSSCGSITENISAFIDHWLQPYVKQLPSYIQNSTSFIKTIEREKFPPNCILASIDVSSLYTNIPHEEGIESLTLFLNDKTQSYKHPEQPTPQILTELANIVLKNNAFEFNEEYYLQKQGTAMGTKMAPAYANLFMGMIETKMTNKHIKIWKRFIDDIFLIWTGTKEELEIYMKTINQIHNTIKFTYEASDKELTFLDITLYKGDRFLNENILDIRTHIKETNKQLYVHADSYHPNATKKAIMKGETKRYLRTNSNKKNFENMKIKLIHKLKHRGYKKEEVLNEIKDITFSERPQTLLKKVKTKNQKIIFSTQFCDNIHKFRRIIHKHWKPVQQDPFLKEIFPERPLIAHKTAPNLRKRLIRAKLKPLDESQEPTDKNACTDISQTFTHLSISQTPPDNPSMNRDESLNPSPNPTQTNPSLNPTLTNPPQPECNSTPNESYPYNLFKSSQQDYRNPIQKCQRNYPLCIHIPTKTFVISTLKRTKHPIDLPPRGKFYNCSSKNIVYLITCNSNKCKAQYVGYTQRACKQRLLEHLTDHRSPVHKHLEENNHERRRITMHILTQAPTEAKDTETWLKQQEYNWICKLGTLTKTSMKGLNKTIFDSTIRT